jgi:hypothetical protein
MKAEVSIALESEDLKDKKLAAFVMKLLAKQAKEKDMEEEMPEDEEA